MADKVERVIHERNLMVVTADMSFFTTFACRLFKSDYYYLSLKLLHRGSDIELVRKLGNAQNDFINRLQVLQTEEPLKAYSAWTEMENSLREIKLVNVRHISAECMKLTKTFETFDAFFIPVFVAQSQKLIPAAQSKMIADKVKILYDAMLRRFSERGDACTSNW